MKTLTKTFLAPLALIAAVGSAFAAEVPSAFVPPPGDVSVGMLRRIFGSVIDGGGAGADMSLLGSMAGVFNSAVLFLAMLFALYTTVKGVVDTCHDGELLGRKMSEVWVPIRTVAGTAFLLPLPSGFSLIQTTVLWLAVQGVGVADAMWSAAMGNFGHHGTMSSLSVPDARPLAANILRAELCRAAMNQEYTAEGIDRRIVTEPVEVTNESGDKIIEYRWRFSDSSTSAAACGSLSWTVNAQANMTSSAALTQPLFQAHSGAVAALIGELRPVAERIATTWQRPAPGVIETAASHYESRISAAAKAAVDKSADVALQSFLKNAETAGWVHAGAWFSSMGKTQDSIQAAVNTVPVSTPVRIDDLAIRESLTTYHDALTLLDEYLLDRGNAPRRSYEVALEDAKSIRSIDDVWRLLSAPAMGALDSLTKHIAGSGENPVEALRGLGNDMVLAGAALKLAYATIAGFAGSGASALMIGTSFSASDALRTVSGTVEFISSGLWALGLMLAFYLPAVPVIWWVAGVIRWMASVCEAVIAAPLLGAMISAEGHDAFGGAGPGLMLILAMVMQPSLMLLGLIISGAMLIPAASLVNDVFLGMVSGITGTGGVGLVALLAWCGIYVGMMTMAIHSCFALVSTVPDSIMRWLGSQAGAQGVGVEQVRQQGAGFDQGSRGAGAAMAKSSPLNRMGGGQGKGGGAGSSSSGGSENGFTNADHLPPAG